MVQAVAHHRRPRIGGRVLPQLQVILEGVFEHRRFLDLVRHFVVFEDPGGAPIVKKMAGYHQFHAVNVALGETLRATRAGGPVASREVPDGRYEAGPAPGGEPGDQRVGVVWHTQGSGKSLTMAFYAGRVILAPDMENPTIVVLTDQLDHAIRQIVSGAIAFDQVVDIFAAAGLKKPDISILSDEFLADVQRMPQRNLAVELLRKLLSGEIRTRSLRNIVQARSFADLLERALRRYQNRAIETAQVIEELIALAKDMRAAAERGEQLGLTDDELAFYDALETNDSAVMVLGEPALLAIAKELTTSVRNSVTIDWTVRENVRAQLRVLVKRILRKYGYPPDMQEKATQTVLEQAAVLSERWATA